MPYTLERSDFTWDRLDEPARDRDRPDHARDRLSALGLELAQQRKRAFEVFADIPDDETQMIVETNARRMLSFPRTG